MLELGLLGFEISLHFFHFLLKLLYLRILLLNLLSRICFLLLTLLFEAANCSLVVVVLLNQLLKLFLLNLCLEVHDIVESGVNWRVNHQDVLSQLGFHAVYEECSCLGFGIFCGVSSLVCASVETPEKHCFKVLSELRI